MTGQSGSDEKTKRLLFFYLQENPQGSHSPHLFLTYLTITETY